jgi:hypothetical protein
MKKFQLLLLISIFCAVTISAQCIALRNQPYSALRGISGYVTINELNGGFGLGDTSVPYSRSLIGFTTVHGYVINNHFTIGGGTGVSFYNEGTMIPLFLDVRYHYLHRRYVPFFFGNGGFLFDVTDNNGGTKLFLNAGPGVRYSISRGLAFNLSTGLLIQMGQGHRDAFINFKLGITFKPN